MIQRVPLILPIMTPKPEGIERLVDLGINHEVVWKEQLPYENSIATITLPKASIYDKVRSIKNAGFDSFELMEPDLSEIIGDLARFKSYIGEIGLKISIFQPFRDLEGSWNGFDDRLNDFRKRLEIMNALDVDLILVCSNCQTPKLNIPQSVFIKQLQIASDLASSKGIKIAYEALSWGTYIKKLEQNWEIIKLVNRPNFGICLDSFHIFIHDSKLDILDEMTGKVFFVQLSDSNRLNIPKILDHSRNYRYLPGQGDFAMSKFVKGIYQVGYSGPLSLECFSGPFKPLKDLDYVSKESLVSLYAAQLNLLKDTGSESEISKVFDSNAGQVEGFLISQNVIIDFRDPNNQPKIEVLAYPQSLFYTRLQILQYGDFFSKHFTESKANDQIQKDIVINCSRLTFNSLLLYLRNVLGLKEESSNKTCLGIPDYIKFSNGIVSVGLLCEENLMHLESSNF